MTLTNIANIGSYNACNESEIVKMMIVNYQRYLKAAIIYANSEDNLIKSALTTFGSPV